ncbi:MAG: hypothetical protein QOI48_505 [Solirubrobacteraceae bacterium]|jgi:tetratricopeptide (TPR) repeat protein|nr:hypothetical protein [Solirubrobacteraceae bacterium]
MVDVIDLVRRLKTEAMDARDLGDLPRALDLLREAEDELRSTLEDLKQHRESGDPPGRQEVAVANQLVHILGTVGGTLRRAGEYQNAVAAYDAGHLFETQDAGYGIVNSYNLVQRLVTRVFVEPLAAGGGQLVAGLDVREELALARNELEEQIAGARSGDEYAIADLATVLLLLDDPRWEKAMRMFVASNPSPYAVEVTEELLTELRNRVGGKLGGVLAEAVERLEPEVA